MSRSSRSKPHPETRSLSARSKPQYHYFYGSTDADNVTGPTTEQEQDSLIGEELVATDHEEDTPNSSERDLQHLMITNGNSTKPWFFTPSPRTGANSHVLGRVLILVLLAAAMSTFLVILIPHTSRQIPLTQATVIPFLEVNRADFGDPVDAIMDLDLFHPTLFSQKEPRTFVFPFPTGAFWTNLVVPSPDGGVSYPIVVYPYAYKWSSSSLQVSYPASHIYKDKHSLQEYFAPELTLSTAEQITNRFVTKFDPLSVTLRFVASPQSKWETSLVQGSPYVTIKYLNSTPIFQALSIFKSVLCPGDEDENFSDLLDDQDSSDDAAEGTERRLFGVCSIDDSKERTTTLRGVQFMFKTQEGKTWIMFSSEPMNLIFDSIRKTTLSSGTPFTGIIRLAYIPVSNPGDTSTDSSTGLRRIIYHAGVYPTGGQISWEFHGLDTTGGKSVGTKGNSTSRHATLHFNYATATMTDNSLRPNAAMNALLMLALPHHAQILSKNVQLNSRHFDLQYRCIKGPMTPVVGATWTFQEPLLDLEFDGPSKDIDPEVRKIILDQVEADLTRVLPTANENVYGFGKQVARLAQLANIADRLRVSERGAKSSDISEKAASLLSSYLQMFLSGGVTDGLLFDSNLGGLVSSNGLKNKGEDFGNGRYNDHHFHYGYILYASAVMGRLDPSFIDRFGSHVDTIFHDIAHASNGDSRPMPTNNVFFPMARHKSWFDGHSFATGMFPFGTGKSQESSSEAVNCYYGAYLWSLVRHGEANVASDITDFTRLLLAMEIRGARTYWHMLPSTALGNNSVASSIYTPDFQENYMVGNLGMLDVAANTWFGTDPLYVHMINAIPITAATAVLFDREYVKYEYPFLMKSRSGVEMAWRGYTVSIHAIIDSHAAWEEAQDLVSYELDAALSKSQVLYWICHRPDFNVSSNRDVSIYRNEGPNAAQPSTSDERGNHDPSSSCDTHSACIALGLSGECCPTPDGQFLSCCGSASYSPSDRRNEGTRVSPSESGNHSPSKASADKSNCSSHPACVDLVLTGECCPTQDNVFLGCCI